MANINEVYDKIANTDISKLSPEEVDALSAEIDSALASPTKTPVPINPLGIKFPEPTTPATEDIPQSTLNIVASKKKMDTSKAAATLKSRGEEKQRILSGGGTPDEKALSAIFSKEAVAGVAGSGPMNIVGNAANLGTGLVLGLPSRIAGAMRKEGTLDPSNEAIAEGSSSLFAPEAEKLHSMWEGYWKGKSHEEVAHQLNITKNDILNNPDLTPEQRKDSVEKIDSTLNELASTYDWKGIVKGIGSSGIEILKSTMGDPVILAGMSKSLMAKNAEQRVSALRNNIKDLNEANFSKNKIDKRTADQINVYGGPEKVMKELKGKVYQKDVGVPDIHLSPQAIQDLSRQLVKPQKHIPGEFQYQPKPNYSFEEMRKYEDAVPQIDLRQPTIKDIMDHPVDRRKLLAGPDITEVEMKQLDDLMKAKDPRKYVEGMSIKGEEPIIAPAISIVERINSKVPLDGTEIRDLIKEINELVPWTTRSAKWSPLQKALASTRTYIDDILHSEMSKVMSPEAVNRYRTDLLFKGNAEQEAKMGFLEKVFEKDRNQFNLKKMEVDDVEKAIAKYYEDVGKEYAHGGNLNAMDVANTMDEIYKTNLANLAKKYGFANRAKLFKNIDANTLMSPGGGGAPGVLARTRLAYDVFRGKGLQASARISSSAEDVLTSLTRDDRIQMLNKLRKKNSKLASAVALKKKLTAEQKDYLDTFLNSEGYGKSVPARVGMEAGMNQPAPADTTQEQIPVPETVPPPDQMEPGTIPEDYMPAE
jgi:hypothetical protein